MEFEANDPVAVIDRRAVVVGVTLGVVALVLGTINIGRSFDYDEAVTYGYFINGGSLRQALTTQLVFNNHQMFSAIQAVGWRVGLVGESAQRLGPVTAGAVTVGLTAWWTARRTNVVAGAFAGAVVALSPVFLEQMRLLRGYALATMAIVVAGVALQASWHDHRRRWLALQGVAMIVAVTTHAYSAVTILMLAVASLVLGKLRTAHFATWVGAAVVAVAIQWPLIDDARSAAESRGSWFNPDFPSFLLRSLLGGTWPIAALVGALVTAGLVAVGRQSSRHAWALVASTSVLCGVGLTMWLVVQPRDLYVRFFVSVIPLLAALAGRGAASVPLPATAGVAVVCTALLVPGVPDVLDADPQIRDAALAIDSARSAGLEVCGWQPEALRAYTAPVPPIAGVDDFRECEVYVSVLGLSGAQRDAATARFETVEALGNGIRLWTQPRRP